MDAVNKLDGQVDAFVQELLKVFPAASEKQQEQFMHAAHAILSGETSKQ